MSIPLISGENPGDSPSVFDKDHFRYEGDDLNYFRLYAELMLDYDTLRNALKNICATNKPYITLAGFTASISRKLVNGAEYWAVTVPEGQDQRKTAADLKKAGFDSFPIGKILEK